MMESAESDALSGSQATRKVSLSPIVGQETGLNKIVSGAVFKRGAAAPLYGPSSRSEEGSQGRRELFCSSRSSSERGLASADLDGLRSEGYRRLLIV
jgi:hypothetical protein